MSVMNASGLGGLEATSLARIGYSDYIVAQGWEGDWIDEITNTRWDEKITHCHQVIQFVREPLVGKWRPYNKSQPLISDEIMPDAFCMEICRARYKSIGVDHLEKMMACDRWDEFERMFIDAVYKRLSAEWKCYIINGMRLEAAKTNKGNNAGRNCDIRLGQPGAPRVVTKDNVHELFAAMRRVLQEQHRWMEGEMFAVIPPALEELVLNSPFFFKVNYTGDSETTLYSGKITGRINGFNIYVSEAVPISTNEPGSIAYNIVAGWKEAYAFAGNIVESRKVQHNNSFTEALQWLAVYDGKALTPNALAVAYITINTLQ